ncbi:MAG: cation-translocating P-type ATPase [Acidobacteria bacterium]|nr:cation-translocating P-type ATPase [Acidobacteriota bacterium]
MPTEAPRIGSESHESSDSRPWHAKASVEVMRVLGTWPDTGLAPEDARRRLAEHGPNELTERGQKSIWRMLWEQLSGTLVVVLIVAAVSSAALGDYPDALAIFAIVVLNATLGLYHERRAERAMAMLKRLAVPVVRVRRGGQVEERPSRELVPGDVVLLEAGNLVPADCRLVECANLRVQESSLTGESEAVDKVSHALPEPDLPLGDRRNMVYMGTTVTYGRGEAVVVETGMQTELGNIADLIQTVSRESTPLQKRLDQFGRMLAAIALVLVGVIFAVGLVRGESLTLMFLTAVSMAVAAVPEGLPAVVAIALALGAQRMLKRNVLIRKLPAVETLGSVTVICSDKTGTLTENRMTVTMLDVAGTHLDVMQVLHRAEPAVDVESGGPIVPGDHPALTLLLAGGALCNDAVLSPQADQPGHFHVLGDPTEGALVVAAARFHLRKPDLDLLFPRVMEVPFDSDRKRMTTVHEMPATPLPAAVGLESLWAHGPLLARHRRIAFTKGAVEQVLQVTAQVWADGRPQPYSADWRARIKHAHDRLAQDGMRVLGLAYRVLDGLPEAEPEAVERELVFVGLIGMSDPPRPEVKNAVATCLQAGIRAVMITGDHPLTARHVARQLGIGDDAARICTGQELAGLSEPDLRRMVDDTAVFARVSPAHKLKIVQALQANGQVVAMTGDGVNDAPALRRADIGVAMGITGTDVSKEAADMVLLDDNFATIVAAVEEGRVIYDNIRKFIRYLLSSNSGELWVMLAAPFIGMPLPLLPLQILWINLVTDGLPALALSVEPAERNAMQRAPVPPRESILGRGLLGQVVWGGLVLGLPPLALGFYFSQAGHEGWRTMVFTTLTLSQLMLVLSIRSERDSFFTIGPLTNVALLFIVAFTFLLQMMVTYVPFWQRLLKTHPLTGGELGLCLALATVPFWADELRKWVVRRRPAGISGN